jgi:enoyl-CoA hydratase/carnithine racemase
MLEARYGLIPDLGGSHRLGRLIGPSRTKEIVWSTRNVEAGEALGIGMLNRVVSLKELAGEASKLLVEVATHSSLVLSLTKSLIDHAPETPFEAELEREAEAPAICVAGRDHRAGSNPFAQRGEPPRAESRAGD